MRNEIRREVLVYEIKKDSPEKLLILLLAVLAFIVVVSDAAHHIITFEYGVGKEYINASGCNALLTKPGGYPSTSPFPSLCLSSNKTWTLFPIISFTLWGA